MTGVAFVVGPCFVCGNLFNFNPAWVPSVPIDPQTNRPLDVDVRGNPQPVDPDAQARAVKQPICEDCISVVNLRRSERGEEPIFVHEHAYEASEPSGW